MYKFISTLVCICLLFGQTVCSQDNGRVQPKFKTVYLPVKKMNRALENAHIIDSLTAYADSLSAVNTNLLIEISGKENLLKELIVLADSEATIIKNTRVQLASLEEKNTKTKNTSNLLLVIAIVSTVFALVLLVLLLVVKKKRAPVAIVASPVHIKQEIKNEPKPEPKAPSLNVITQTNSNRDPSHTLIQLERLAKMREMGVLTQEEFVAQKRDVLKDN